MQVSLSWKDMGRLKILMTCQMILILIFSDDMTAGDDPNAGYHSQERDALYALKHAFNNPTLNKNWNHLQCYMNNPNTTWIGISCIDGRVTGISLPDMGLSGQINETTLVNLTRLTLLNFRNNSISGNLMDFSANRNLTHVDLSGNMFGGPISPSLVGLDFIESLQLQDNFLEGGIPPFDQSSLREFNVSNNNLSGDIPQTRVLQSFNLSSYLGNPGLCGPPTSTVCPHNGTEHIDKPDPGKKKKKSDGFLESPVFVIFVVLVVIALACVVFFFCFYSKKVKSAKEEGIVHEEENSMKNKNEKKVEIGEKKVITEEETGKLTFVSEGEKFELNDLLKASAQGLGKGNFGACYKANLNVRSTFVVKRLKDLNPCSGQEFERQMRALADLKHPNLMPLIAYYHSKEEKLLVYKFARNGNLFNRIHLGRGNNRVPFKWNSRLLVAKGVARAIAFLHSSGITHGNIKSSNVLLDENDFPLVTDYGFSSLVSLAAVQRMVSYKTPEGQQRRKISEKSDVWCYANLLLELVTGRLSSHNAPLGVDGIDLCNWVHRAVREEWTAEIFDAEIVVQRRASEGMVKLLQIAMRCCDKTPEKRPEMVEVLRDVENVSLGDSSYDETDDSLDSL